MKKRYLVLGMIILVVTITAILSLGLDKDFEVVEIPTHVVVEPADSEQCDIGLDYLGAVMSKETTNYASMTGGKISTLLVSKGDFVKKGDTLATLDKTVMQLNRQSAVENLDNLDATIKAMESSLATMASVVEASRELHTAGALSDMEWAAKQAEYDMQKAAYTNLVGNRQISNLQMAILDETIDNANIVADADGYVMELPYQVNEIVGPGYPIVIIKSMEQVVTIGLSTEDYPKISKSSRVLINDSITGEIVEIAAYPNEKDRTYAVDIQFDSSTIALGQIVNVKVITGSETGVFVPISSIFTIDGMDYVYTVNSEDILKKQQVTRGELRGSKVRISNLSTDILVVTENIKNLKENEKVTVSIRKAGIDQ
jgi:RND family efflux transporter MFP subunit